MNATETLIPIGGNTYPVKGQLSALGGTYDGVEGWRVPADKAEEAFILAGIGADTAREIMEAIGAADAAWSFPCRGKAEIVTMRAAESPKDAQYGTGEGWEWSFVDFDVRLNRRTAISSLNYKTREEALARGEKAIGRRSGSSMARRIK